MTPSPPRAFPGPQVPVAAVALTDPTQVGAVPSGSRATSVSKRSPSNESRLRALPLRPLCLDSRGAPGWAPFLIAGVAGCGGTSRTEGPADAEAWKATQTEHSGNLEPWCVQGLECEEDLDLRCQPEQL